MKKNEWAYETRVECDRHGDDEIVVLYKGQEVFRWSDSAQVNYPEDLCWSRMISEVFDAGVRLGQLIQDMTGKHS
jgi:hypothetical protein